MNTDDTGFASYTADAPPHVTDVLREAALKMTGLAKHWHTDVPRTASELAAWWPTMQDPPSDKEAPSNHDGVWKCPYHERLLVTLAIFLTRPAEEQSIIIEARKDGVYWRGDDIAFFARVWDETLRMRQMGVEEYRKSIPSLCMESMPESKD